MKNKYELLSLGMSAFALVISLVAAFFNINLDKIPSKKKSKLNLR